MDKQKIIDSLAEIPDKIIVGESRGEEAYKILQEMKITEKSSFTTMGFDIPFLKEVK